MRSYGPQKCPFVGGSGPLPNTRFLGPRESTSLSLKCTAVENFDFKILRRRAAAILKIDLMMMQNGSLMCIVRPPSWIFKICNFWRTVHTHPFNGPFPGLPGSAGTTKVKPIWILLKQLKARDSEWQQHQLGYMQVCTSLQADNHASTPPLSFLQAGCPSCRPTNSVKALKYSAIERYVLHHHAKVCGDRSYCGRDTALFRVFLVKCKS